MKKIFTSLSLLLFSLVAINAQTYFFNGFEGTPPIEGWAIFDNGIGTENNWNIYQAGVDGSNAAAVAYENVADGTFAEDYLATPLIDLSTATNPRLTFMSNQSYDTNYGSTFHVLVSTTSQNEIDAYTEVASWNEDTLGLEFTLQIVDLSAYVGQQIYIAFMMRNDDGDNFIIDNVTVEEGLAINATLSTLNISRYLLSNQDTTLEFDIRNSGSTEITSLQLNWNDGTDHSSTVDVNIPSGATTTVNHPVAINYSTVQQYDITASIDLVNGSADENPEDNSLMTSVNVISQDGGKKVLFEEGTGTWCGWCPRGAVAMDYMAETHPETFIGIAVHNNDPMTLAEYNDGASIQGFPGMNVDRVELGAGVGIDTMEAFLNAYSQPTPVAISATSALSGRDITVDASATFYSNFNNSNFRLGLILVEDHVTGTSSGYAQANYYAGGGSGEMNGYENLPNPVPASEMVYDHVGRALIGGYNGLEGTVPTNLVDGQSISHTFSYTVPEEFDLDHLHGVVVLIDQSNGSIVNANKFDINSLSVNDLAINTDFAIFPNPAKEQVSIRISENGNYNAIIYNMTGKQVSSFNLNELSNNESTTIPVNNLKPGVYILTLAKKGKSFSKKLIIK